MRTTIDIDDDVLAAARALAGRDGVSIGKALSLLAREALTRPVAIGRTGRVPTFDVAPDAPRITDEMVRVALDEP
jgi:hypothetical protein